MKTNPAKKVKNISRSRVVTVNMLFFLSSAITLSGILFSVYAIIFDISFKVLNTVMPGAIFGLIVAYLGIRYFFLVKKLRAEVYGTTAKFNWNNFKPKNFFAKAK